MTPSISQNMLDSNQFLRFRQHLQVSQDHPPKQNLCMICGQDNLILNNHICDWCNSNFPIKPNKTTKSGNNFTRLDVKNTDEK